MPPLIAVGVSFLRYLEKPHCLPSPPEVEVVFSASFESSPLQGVPPFLGMALRRHGSFSFHHGEGSLWASSRLVNY